MNFYVQKSIIFKTQNLSTTDNLNMYMYMNRFSGMGKAHQTRIHNLYIYKLQNEEITSL